MADTQRKANILLVDDRPASLLALETALGELDQNLVTAASGRQALRYALEMEFAVILLDVHMPGMDGLETAELLRRRRSCRHTPIIFITGYADELHVARGYSLGAVDYILAPVVPEVLRAKVGVFVELFKKNHEVARQAASLERRAEQLHALTQASMIIHSVASARDTVQVVADTARRLLQVEHASVTLVPDQYLRRPLSAVSPAREGGSADARPSADGDGDGDARAEGADGPAGDRAAAVERADALTVALTGRDGREMGLIEVAEPRQGDLDADDRAILLQLAQIASIAIENILIAKAREANRLKDEFLATLSHELRTPLNAMLGWIRLLRTEEPDAAMLDTGLQVIERNVNAQTRLIEDLLDISRITSGKLRLSREPMALNPVLEAAVDAARPAAEAKQITLHVELAAPARVMGDPDRLQQVVWNLLSNAIKFTPEQGEVWVSLETDEGETRVSVQDSGEGIPRPLMPYIFERFRQADSSSTRSHSGLGVGLAIVQHIVQRHRGRVEARSAGPGKGAEFIVRLPLLNEAAAEDRPPPAVVGGPAAAEAAEGTAGQRLSGLRVLVVDDEPDTRELVGRIIQQHEGEAATANSVAEALQLLDDWTPDLLLSDIAMPESDGYTLLSHLRAHAEARLRELPAVALTAYAGEGDRQRAAEVGFCEHLAKPVEPEQLVATLARIGAAPGQGGGDEDDGALRADESPTVIKPASQ